MRIALCVFGILLMAGVAPQIWCAVQGQVELEPTNFRDAILITKITVGGVEVQCGQNGPPGGRASEPVAPFPANDNWPLGMEISIFNRTNKVIAAGRIDLSFLKSGIESGPAPIEMQSGHSVPTIHLDFGVIPQYDLMANGKPYPHRPDEFHVSLPPAQTFVLRTADYADKIAKAMAAMTPNRVPARIFVTKESIFFDDGMRWSGNLYGTPDPNRPGRWVYQDQLYFPGNRYNHWPVPGNKWTPGPGK
jgi:hypothetical protein